MKDIMIIINGRQRWSRPKSVCATFQASMLLYQFPVYFIERRNEKIKARKAIVINKQINKKDV